ncbi:MAG: O-antigen ligase family protein [Ignavibacteriaceae bacterium]|nr:O-antigen ligase family protein [Ignavibacteriaceae bacterium]
MNPEKVVKYSVPFFVIAIISRSIEEVSFIYYTVPVMCVFFIVLLLISSKSNVQSHHKQENQRTDIRHPESGIKHPSSLLLRRTGLPSSIIHQPYFLFLLPGLWFLLTALWSSYPEVSAARALYFILISIGSIAAGILWIRYSNKNIFDFLLPANLIVVLLCVFSLITNIPFDSWTAGHGKGFMGFFGHQNLLASVILFTIPTVFGFKIKDQSKKLKVLLFILLTLNFILLILTYSRSAILSLIFGVIVFLILNRNWKVLAYGFAIAAVHVIVIYSIPSLNQFTDTIIKKDFPEVYSSRMWMWEPSYKAALEGGLFGLGYGISHPEISSGEYSDRFEDGRLIREKGNSVLALVEEAGVIGLILFLLPIIYLLQKLPDLAYRQAGTRYQTLRTDRQLPDVKDISGIRHPASPSSLHYAGAGSILVASLAAFILHAQFEAWWVGVGSVQLPLFFIYISLLTDFKLIRFK